MMHDPVYNFDYHFDRKTGFYVRGNILDEWGNDTGKEPFIASFPHLIDVGIMGHCIHGLTGRCQMAGIGCYQSGGAKKKTNMLLSDFERIAAECHGKTVQFALGGRGDPNQHENFREILRICERYDIVPNYTTSGYQMRDEQVYLTGRYCGAVAVSWYRSQYSIDAIKAFIKEGCKVNVHYVLSNKTVDEAIDILSDDFYCKGINALVFLLHKPVGQGLHEDNLSISDPRVKEFCRLVSADKKRSFKIGFDSCSVPMLLNFGGNIDPDVMDTCEGARFSCYISSDMIMSPCSFDRDGKCDEATRYGVSLEHNSIKSVWNSSKFEEFRNCLRNTCPGCKKRDICMGGCPLERSIVLCKNV